MINKLTTKLSGMALLCVSLSLFSQESGALVSKVDFLDKNLNVIYVKNPKKLSKSV